MRVAVAGGAGLVGRHVVRSLAEHGHEPMVLARSTGVDLTTGDGLDDALRGARAVIDVTNVTTTRRAESVEFFSTVSRTLVAASERTDVPHVIALSIVGIDDIDLGYYEGKRLQERILLDGPVPATVLRAAQFHEFAGQVLDRGGFGPVAFVPSMRCQPIAAREVAEALAARAPGPAVGRAPDLAGPRQEQLVAMARRLVRASGRRRVVLPLRIPGAAGRAMAEGAARPEGPGPRGVQTFEEWLAGPDAADWT